MNEGESGYSSFFRRRFGASRLIAARWQPLATYGALAPHDLSHVPAEGRLGDPPRRPECVVGSSTQLVLA